MVQRASEPVRFNTGGAVAPTASQLGFVRPKAVQENTQEQGLLRTLDTVLGTGSQLAAKAFQVSTEEAYLDGVRQAATGVVSAELQSEPLTADWSRAGFEDTRGSLLQTQSAASVLKDMNKLRELTPEEFSNELRIRSIDVLSNSDGMSREKRAALLARQQTLDTTLIAKHGEERYKWIVDVRSAELKAQNTTNLQMVLDARTSKGGFEAAKQNAVVGITAVAADQSLGDDIKRTLVEGFVTQFLDNNIPGVVEALQSEDAMIPGPDGKPISAWDYLDVDQQTKLAEANRQMRERAYTVTEAAALQNFAKIRAGWADESTPIMAEEDAATAINDMRNRGIIKTADEYEGAWKEYYGARNRRGSGSNMAMLAQVYQTGDTPGRVALQATPLETLKAAEQSVLAQYKDLPKEEQFQRVLDMHLGVGVNQYQPVTFTRLGELVNDSVTRWGQNGLINESDSATVNKVLRGIEEAERRGNTHVRSVLLAGMSEDNARKFLRIQEELRRGTDPKLAAALIEKDEQALKNLTPQQKASMYATKAGEDTKLVQEGFTPTGVFGGLWSGIKGIFSQEATLRNQASPVVGLFEDSAGANMAMQGTRLALTEELSRIGAVDPLAPAERRQELAVRAVLARTIPVGNTALTLPQGTKPQTYFGVPNADTATIGRALADLVKPGSTGDMNNYTVLGNGQIMVQSMKSDGSLTGPGFIIEPRAVGQRVLEMDSAKAQASKDVYQGTVVTQGRNQVLVHGRNTAGVDPNLMFQIRKDLVQHEGIRDTSYEDASNAIYGRTKKVMTQGVGISSTNDHFIPLKEGETLTQQQMAEQFRAASDAAVKAAVQAQAVAGLRDPGSLKLFTGIAYQGGKSDATGRAAQLLARAIAEKNQEAAKLAFDSTSTGKLVGQLKSKSRQAYYYKLIQEATKE